MEAPPPAQQSFGSFQAAQSPALPAHAVQQQTQIPPRNSAPGKALQPRRRGGTKRKSRWLKGRAGGQRDGAGANFNRMRRQNAMRSRQHFGTDTPWSVPRTAPRAPDNDNSFLLAQYGRDPETPATESHQWDKSYRGHGSSTDLGAQLDFFGTNEGVVTGYTSSDTSSSSMEDAANAVEGDHHDEVAMSYAPPSGVDGSNRGLPDHIRVRLQSQSMYIAQLEDQNLDLQEKYSLLQHELQEARAAARRAVAPVPTEHASGSAS